jgi:uncharacterized protein
MPPYDKHLETSFKRTGKSHQALHDWLDNYPQMKAERHSLDKLPDNINFVLSLWGKEGVVEYLQHIVEDAAMQDIETLQKAGCPDEAVNHSIEVARKALEISSRVKIPVDRKLIICGGIYHDLGKAKTYGMQHGEIGAQMAKELNLGDDIMQIILKHVRGGLTEPEAVELGLPVRDYTLKTPEEKIVIYADRMVDIYTDGIVPNTDEKDAEDRFIEILNQYEKYGKNPVTLKRYVAMHNQIHEWINKQGS